MPRPISSYIMCSAESSQMMCPPKTLAIADCEQS